jgi:Domain of unknown function (DUF4169)
MAEIVNLKRVRKAKARATKDEIAVENRARHGVPKAERRLTKARSDKLARDHDSTKLDTE